ncbi:MAG: hypothetical protein Q4P12_06670, partial [Bacteroidales bacterium]|nr:hypothetical protein [Bacteroidales bacterium]
KNRDFDYPRGSRDDRNTRRDKADKPGRSEKKGKKGSGEVRGSAKADHTPKGAAEWAKYFEGQVESQPFYNGFTKKKGKKK